MPTPQEQTIIDEAMSAKAAKDISPEAQYYRGYGKFQTTAPVVAPVVAPSVPTGVTYNPATNISTVTSAPKPVSNLTRVATGSTGPSGETIYDVFSGTEHIKDPNDPRLKGINIQGLPEGSAPEGFKSKFLPVTNTNIDEDIVSDTTKERAAIDKTAQEIKDFAANLGIVPPGDDEISATTTAILDSIKKRQADMDKREADELAQIEAEYATGKEELTTAQTEEKARAEGRTRIGGFIVRSEIEDLERMDRQHRLEMTALTSSKNTAIQKAQAAYNDADFELAQAQLQIAKDIENTQATKKQNYFDNLLKSQAYYDRLNKPLKDAEQANIDAALDMITKAPTAFKDIKRSDVALGKVTYGDILSRYLDSDEYELKLRGEKASVARAEQLAGGETPEEEDVITLYGNIAQQIIDAGLSPQDAVDAVSEAAYKANTTLGLDDKAIIKKYAQGLTKKTVVPEEATSVSKIEQDIQNIKTNTPNAIKDGIKYGLKLKGYTQNEINNSSIGSWVDKVGETGSTVSSFFSRLFSK